MAVLIPGGPVLVLPAGTEATEAERLSVLLDNHGVSGLLGALDAVAAMVSAPATDRKPLSERNSGTAKRKGKRTSAWYDKPRCGLPNRSGMPCGRPVGACPYHRPPASGTEPAVVAEVVPASDGDGDGEPAEADEAIGVMPGADAGESAGAADTDPGTAVTPAPVGVGCPKCGAPPAMVIVKRMPDRTTDLVCLACGRRQLVGVNPLAA